MVNHHENHRQRTGKWALAASAFALSATLAITGPALASAFIGGTVDTSTASPPNTPLNVRVLPKPTSTVWMALPNGSNVSLTGLCRRYNASYTTVISSFNLHNLSTSVAQPKMQLSRTWCRVWVEKPTNSGSFSNRWISAKYVTLM